MPRFVDPVLVDDDCSDEAAELDQRMPVPAIACQARSFDRKHSAGPALADCGQQAFEARAADARAGTAKIVVDDRDLLPAELTRAIGQSVLAAAAFMIVQQLIRRRLADINKSATRQMLRHNLCHRRSPLRQRRRRRCRYLRQHGLDQKNQAPFLIVWHGRRGTAVFEQIRFRPYQRALHRQLPPLLVLNGKSLEASRPQFAGREDAQLEDEAPNSVREKLPPRSSSSMEYGRVSHRADEQ